MTDVQVALSSLNEHDLEVVVQIGQASSHHTTTATTAAHDDVDLFIQPLVKNYGYLVQ